MTSFGKLSQIFREDDSYFDDHFYVKNYGNILPTFGQK
jgi:hypothetical protein